MNMPPGDFEVVVPPEELKKTASSPSLFDLWSRTFAATMAPSLMAWQVAAGMGMVTSGFTPVYDPKGRRSRPDAYWLEFFGLNK